MPIFLSKGYSFEYPEKYTILEVLGRGASTVAYLAECNEVKYILKEYCPCIYSLDRNSSNELICTRESDIEEFEKGKAEFVSSGKIQNKLRQIPSLTNQIPPVYSFFCANNTCYTVVSCYNGKTLDKLQDLPLLQKLEICHTIAKLTDYCHKEGYLCLDIKPENIFILQNTSEDTITQMVEYIDFDSIRKKDEIKFGNSISFTRCWAAPEQINPHAFGQICEATDIYSLGELIFWLVFNRHSYNNEHRSFSNYPFDEVNNVNTELKRPVLQRLFTNLFRKTLRSAVKNRLSSVSDLIILLEELIEVAKKKEWINNTTIRSNSFFIGREKEINSIEEKIKKYDVVFLSGIGGIGKSEIAKQYYNSHKSEYNTTLFLTYEGSLERMICDDTFLDIQGIKRAQEESDSNYCNRKIEKMQELMKGNNLIVIDNLNVMFDEIDSPETLKKLLALPCRFLITTKCHYLNSDDKQIEINEFEDIKKLKLIFKNYCNCSCEEDKLVEKIITNVDRHTYAVELIAKTITAEHTTVSDMLDKLEQHGVSSLNVDNVRTQKDGQESNVPTTVHFERLFSLAKMDDDKQMLLAQLAFMPLTGVKVSDFCAFFAIDNHNDLNWLIEHGWVYCSRGYVRVHPLIADTFINHTKKYDVQFFEIFYDKIVSCMLSCDSKNISQDSHMFICNQTALATTLNKISIKSAAVFIIRYVDAFINYGDKSTKTYLLDFAIKTYQSQNTCSYSALLESAYQKYVYLQIDQNKTDEVISIAETHLKQSEKNKDIYTADRWCIILLLIYEKLATVCPNIGILTSVDDSDWIIDVMAKYFIPTFKTTYKALAYSIFICLDKKMRRPYFFNNQRLHSLDYNYLSNYSESFPALLLHSYADFFEKRRYGKQFTRFKNKELGDLYIAQLLRTCSKKLRFKLNETDNSIIELNKARILILNHKYEKAKNQLLSIVEYWKMNNYLESELFVDIYEMLGYVFYQLNQFENARRYYMLQLKIEQKFNYKSNYSTLLILGNIHIQLGEYDASLEVNTQLYKEICCLDTSERNKYYATAIYNLAKVSFIQGKYELAILQFSEAIKEYLLHDTCSIGIARCYRDLSEVYLSKPNLSQYLCNKDAKTVAGYLLNIALDWYKLCIDKNDPEYISCVKRLKEIQNN